ncbi:hypothetical protein [Aquibacillus sediminis]|uniref:hypothetical protein n=1 Tax=Aquibacillus sediminis TaxID=2574734 RepID=UPI001109CF91|nr:hypothetical protein [Aquibacillus sediminis]
MKHPYKQFVQLQLLMMALTVLIGTMALINANRTLALLTCFTLALSFAFEGIVELKKRHTFLFAQQILRAFVIIIFTCYLYF